MKSRFFLVLLFLCALFARPEARSAPREPGRSWQFTVAMPDLARGLLDVTMTLRGFSGDVRLCLYMDDAEASLKTIKRVGPGPKLVEKDGCWRLPVAQPGGTSVAYQYDLRELARRHGQPDYAQRVENTYLFNDQAVLLHPSPIPAAANIEVEFHLPPNMPVVTPWTPVEGRGQGQPPRFRFDTAQHDGGSYLGIGPELHTIGALSVGKTASSQLHIINLPHVAKNEDLRTWISEALAIISGFYGDLVGKEMLVFLIPVAGSSEPGIFGTVLRPHAPSAVIYFGAECKKPNLHEDWLAVHEMFHIGNPLLEYKIPWFVEGFTTYYQDILRGRAHVMSPEEVFSDLHDSVVRFCQPEGGASLSDESRALRSTRRYLRVYWGGACLAFLSDLAIRARSGGKRGLDEVMRSLRKKSLLAPLDEEEILNALDAETGDKLISRALSERHHIDFTPWYRRFGIEPIAKDRVRLIDTAPDAAARRAILAPPQ